MSYPKMVYTERNGKVVHTIVNTPSELKALGHGWAESPEGPFTTPKRVAPKPKMKR
jgi:hypothetical protein